MRAFTGTSFFDFKELYFKRIWNEIESKDKEYLLKVDQKEYTEYLRSKYFLEKLEIIQESEIIDPPIKSKERTHDQWGEEYESDVYSFNISYTYQGTTELFSIQSNPWSMTSNDIEINSSKKKVSFKLTMYKQDAELFKREKENYYKKAFANMVNMNKNIEEINGVLDEKINRFITSRKEFLNKENDFFNAINVKVNPDTENIFTTPTIEKVIVPQPAISEANSVPEVTMANEMYEDILGVIYNAGKSMERKPALYKGKDEEEIRDLFLFHLETRYKGITATGETFNLKGKTDILLKNAEDGSNLFVAECKVWHGQSEYLEAISQLFDNYLTWRDSKVAIMMFAKNKDFSNVLQVIESMTRKHKYFKSIIGKRGNSSFSYEFHLPQDKASRVFVEVMAFHYDK